MDERVGGGGGRQDIPSNISCLTVPKKAVEEPFSLSSISGIEKIYASEGYVTIFRRKFFVSRYRKHIVGERFSLSLISGIEKNLCFRGLCHDFPSKIFCLPVPKNFVEEPFCAVFQKNSGSEKVYG